MNHAIIARFSALLLAAAALASTACGSSFQPPRGFVELDDAGVYDHRATSADGLVLATRHLDNDQKGELAFWTRAIENELRLRGGYALLETRDVKHQRGLTGKELHFGHDAANASQLYTVALYVTPESIHLIEAGGTRELMETNKAQVDWAVRNLPLD